MARFLLLGFCLVALGVSPLSASESEELREKAKAIQREAATLAENGHKEEAERLQAMAKELLQAAERLDREQKRPAEDQGPVLEKLEIHLKGLLARAQQAKESNASKEDQDKLREHIEATKGRIDEIRSQRKRGPDRDGGDGPNHEVKAKLAEAMERVHHLRIAAEHLGAAGAADLSRQVAQQAEQMEREVRQTKEHLMRGTAEHGAGLPMQIEELRREVRRLREEMDDLRRQKNEK